MTSKKNKNKKSSFSIKLLINLKYFKTEINNLIKILP